MRRLLRGLIVVVLLIPPAAGPLWARSAPCTQIRAALAAGKTIEQVASEFNTDAARVTQCTQARGRRRGRARAERTPRVAKTPKSTSLSNPKPHGESTPRQNAPTPRRSVLGRPHP